LCEKDVGPFATHEAPATVTASFRADAVRLRGGGKDLGVRSGSKSRDEYTQGDLLRAKILRIETKSRHRRASCSFAHKREPEGERSVQTDSMSEAGWKRTGAPNNSLLHLSARPDVVSRRALNKRRIKDEYKEKPKK